MVNKDIVRYFKEGIERGFSIEELKNELIKHGHHETDVQEAINTLPKKHQPTSHQDMHKQKTTRTSTGGGAGKLGFFKKIGMSFAHPRQLFNATSDEGTWKSLKYYFLLVLIPFLLITLVTGIGITIFISAIQTLLQTAGPGADVPEYLNFIISFSGVALFGIIAAFMFVQFYVLGPIFSFIGAAFLHLGLKIVKAKGKYSQTYSAIIYSATPGLILFTLFFILSILIPPLLLVFSLISFVPGIWSLVLLIIGFAENHQISGGRAFFGWLIGLIISMIIFSIPMIIISLMFVN